MANDVIKMFDLFQHQSTEFVGKIMNQVRKLGLASNHTAADSVAHSSDSTRSIEVLSRCTANQNKSHAFLPIFRIFCCRLQHRRSAHRTRHATAVDTRKTLLPTPGRFRLLTLTQHARSLLSFFSFQTWSSSGGRRLQPCSYPLQLRNVRCPA